MMEGKIYMPVIFSGNLNIETGAYNVTASFMMATMANTQQSAQNCYEAYQQPSYIIRE
jgi:hypothetical protein